MNELKVEKSQNLSKGFKYYYLHVGDETIGWVIVYKDKKPEVVLWEKHCNVTIYEDIEG